MLCIAGKNNIAVDVLRCAIQKYGKSQIVVLPNRTDTGKDGWQRSLRRAADRENIPIVNMDVLFGVERLLFLSLEYDEIIAPGLFVSDRLFNIHFSALPKYRGMYTSCWPILNGEKESGVTIHKIDAGIDTGNIIDQIRFDILPDDTAIMLYTKYIKYGTMLATANLDSLISGDYTAIMQNNHEATYYSKRSIDYANLTVDFQKPADAVKNQIRGYFFPEYQTAICFGKKISSCKILNSKSGLPPGTLSSIKDKTLVVSTIDYDVELSVIREKSGWV